MESTDTFERYSGTYIEEVERVIRFTGKNIDFFTKVKTDLLLKHVQTFLGEPDCLTALDVGCGVGVTDSFLSEHFKTLHGIDLSENSLTKAKLANPNVHYSSYSESRFPFDDKTFNVAFAASVFHHIPIEQRLSVLSEMKRVTKPRGLIVLFEHNPWNPLTRFCVARCRLDRDAHLLSLGSSRRLLRQSKLSVVAYEWILLFPFSHPFFRKSEERLGHFPLGAQYCIVAKNAEPL